MMAVPTVKLPDAIVTLSDEHRYLSLLLDTLEEQLQSTDLTATGDFFLIQDIVHYLYEYTDAVHHPTEDLMFEKLLKRDPTRESDVTHLRRDHVSLHKDTARIQKLLNAAAKHRTPKAAEAVRVSARKYIDRLRRHIQFEETDLFPGAVRCLASRDWHAIEVSLEARQDPLFGPTVERDYRVLYEYFASRADQLSRQMTRFSFLQLDNMILSADAIETGIAETWDLLQQHGDTLAREFKYVTDNSFDGRGLAASLALQAGFAGLLGSTAIDITSGAASIYVRTLKKAVVSFFKGTQ
jgi:hemerythrin-like domain-containing protein